MPLPPSPFAHFVEHPRFGKGPRGTGLDPANTPDGSVFLHWHSGPDVRVPGTAIAAATAEQLPATVQVTHYFDAKRICRKCRRPFLFFAEEQKHWYEVLKFPLEADCLECVPCRKEEQHLHRAQREYAALLADPARSEEQTLDLVERGVLLVESAVHANKSLPRLRALLKPALVSGAGSIRSRAEALSARIKRVEGR